MFVRWKKRALTTRVYTEEKRPSPWGVDGWLTFASHHDEVIGWVRTAYLIQAIRTPAGPRQEYLCRLGAIETDAQGSPTLEARAKFWREADRQLEGRGDAADRARIVAALEAVVPRPDLPRDARKTQKTQKKQ
jgi:hypothetical protein